MKFPVMLRETHDREMAALERLLAMAEQAKTDAHQAALDAMRLYEVERRRYDELLAQRTQQATTHRAASQLTAAIRENARGADGMIDPRLVNHFRGEANKLLAQGKAPQEIIETISTWQTTETTDRLTVDRMLAESV